MEIVKDEQKRTLKPFPFLTLHEYDMEDPYLGAGIAELDGRYPEKDFVTNESSRELVYVLRGSGNIIMPDKEIPLSAGDVLLIAPGDVYAWSGKMALYMANTPRFKPTQHRNVAYPNKKERP